MSYQVEFTSTAQREFVRLPKADRLRIGRRVEALAEEPRPAGCTKLVGTVNSWRIRCGDYRVIYAIEDDALIITVIRVRHRRDVYRDL